MHVKTILTMLCLVSMCCLSVIIASPFNSPRGRMHYKRQGIGKMRGNAHLILFKKINSKTFLMKKKACNKECKEAKIAQHIFDLFNKVKKSSLEKPKSVTTTRTSTASTTSTTHKNELGRNHALFKEIYSLFYSRIF